MFFGVDYRCLSTWGEQEMRFRPASRRTKSQLLRGRRDQNLFSEKYPVLSDLALNHCPLPLSPVVIRQVLAWLDLTARYS